MSKKIKALLIKPDEPPKVVDIDYSLESLQNLVGGWTEEVCPFVDDVALICNEEGKMIGLKLNRALRDESGKIYDIVAGDFLICGLDEYGYCDLSEELINKYTMIFRHPEMFVHTENGINAIRIPIVNLEELLVPAT